MSGAEEPDHSDPAKAKAALIELVKTLARRRARLDYQAAVDDQRAKTELRTT